MAKISEIFHNIATYLREVRDELKKVIWPSRKDLTKHTIIVIGVSLGVAVFLGVLDLVFSFGIEKILERF